MVSLGGEGKKRATGAKFYGWVREIGRGWKREVSGTEEEVRKFLVKKYDKPGWSTVCLPGDETPTGPQQT